MTTQGGVRRSWNVSKRTADSLNRLQIISGVGKSDLVDISINLLFQTVKAVRACTGMSSHDIIRSIANTLPADARNDDIQIESSPLDIDISTILHLVMDGLEEGGDTQDIEQP